MIVSPGVAERVRSQWAAVVAGQVDGIPEALLSKVRLVEQLALPVLSRILRIGDVRTIADLLPADDETMTVLLAGVHDWTGNMLAVDALEQTTTPVDDDVDGEPAS